MRLLTVANALSIGYIDHSTNSKTLGVSRTVLSEMEYGATTTEIYYSFIVVQAHHITPEENFGMLPIMR